LPARTYRIVGLIAVAVTVLSSINPAHAAQQPDRVVRIQIETANSLGTIPEDFIGFGYETSAVAQSDFFAAKNTRMIRLYSNLARRGLIRIGGNVSDHTQFIPDGTPAVKTERETTVINRENLAGLSGFAQATGWRVMWGLNLGTGTREQATVEAVAVDQSLGPYLQSFEIGNEVDLMRKFKDFDAYHAAYVDYKATIRARLPHATFSGPDAAGSLEFARKFVAAESADMKLVTHHYYRTGARRPEATMDFLLARDQRFDVRLDLLRDLATQHHLDYRINEVNSFYGGGKQGVSDVFGSALWCLDFMFNLASHGCSGVNMETDINQLGFISFYSPIVHDAAGICSARPEYYGMLAFAMAGHGRLLKTSVDKGDVNLAAYATRDGSGSIYLTVINKDLAQDVTIECPLPAGCKTVEAYRLSAPAPDARTGITFAGRAVSDDGSWALAIPAAVPVVAGVARPALPHASAAVLKFATE